jgi:hypothetical protein
MLLDLLHRSFNQWPQSLLREIELDVRGGEELGQRA